MNEIPAEPSRSQRLKAATRSVHDALDKRIMAADIFASRGNFARFLRVQYRFHRDVDPLYASAQLEALLPELCERRRLPKIADDLGDLGQLPPPPAPCRLDGDTPLPSALGWLYVAEGSNLGGAILFKLAGEKLGLGRDFGARHLAAHPDGAARHWRGFTAALDALALSPAQEDEVVRGAEAAFRAVRGYAEEELPQPATDFGQARGA
ncbi:MAG: biliverdin-producing heme oxygenase [Pseudoxanthomonas sp.]